MTKRPLTPMTRRLRSSGGCPKLRPFADHCFNVSWRTTARKDVLENFVLTAAALEFDYAMSYGVKVKDVVQVRNFITFLDIM